MLLMMARREILWSLFMVALASVNVNQRHGSIFVTEHAARHRTATHAIFRGAT